MTGHSNSILDVNEIGIGSEQKMLEEFKEKLIGLLPKDGSRLHLGILLPPDVRRSLPMQKLLQNTVSLINGGKVELAGDGRSLYNVDLVFYISLKIPERISREQLRHVLLGRSYPPAFVNRLKDLFPILAGDCAADLRPPSHGFSETHRRPKAR